MDYFHALILGIIEGFTEFLPISSTGHMILSTSILNLQIDKFMKNFLVIIQLGSILAVIFVLWRHLMQSITLWLKLAAAFIPTGFIGLLASQLNFKDYLYNGFVVAFMLIVGGLVFILIEISHKKKLEKFKPNLGSNLASNSNLSLNSNLGSNLALNSSENLKPNKNSSNFSPNSAKFSSKKAYKINSLNEIGFKEALLIGLFQALAIIPGTSRSGASIIGGLLLGLNRRVAAEFSFLLAIPTIFAATFYDFFKTPEILHSFFALFSVDKNADKSEAIALVIGFIAAFLIALLVIKIFLNFISKFSFIPFGIYRIALGIIFLALFFGGILSTNLPF